MKSLIALFLLVTISYGQTSFDDNTSKDSKRNKGYFNITRFSYIAVNNVKQDIFIPGEGGYSIDLPSGNAKAFSLQTINGYFFNPYFSVGAGIGLDGYHEPNINTFPVFLDIRGYLSDNYNSLFAFMDIGTLLHLGNEFERGNMFNIGLGYKVFLNRENRIAITPEFGYSVKTVSLTDEKVKTSNNTVNVTGLYFSVGFIF